VIASFSTGWENYRHQADALRQYQLLRAAGVDDDHIILIAEDDLAGSGENPNQGEVWNEPGGENLYQGVEIDYDTNLSASGFAEVLTGAAAGADLDTTEGSNVYVYLVGHGGTAGMPIGADTVSEGLDGQGDTTLSPELLRETLCAMSEGGRLRRALVVIDSCYSGAFGEAEFGGIEAGCGTEQSPLGGVVMMTAANTTETSLSAQYDADMGVWLADEFSHALSSSLARDAGQAVFDLYKDGYYGVSGSHVSLFNTAHAGQVSDLSVSEFFTP